MSNRTYNKLLINRNREEGSEKLFLGYNLDVKEITLKRDTETYFHVPHNTTPVKLSDSNLIASGAIGGPFPAASDRIFKSKKNYGKYTQHGNPTDVEDGTWFCSWLYKGPNGQLIWMDRFFNPGAYVTTSSMLSSVYSEHNPVFKDVASSLILEPGVLYKYFHLGEQSIRELLETFSGKNKDKISLNLTNWQSGEVVDTSLNKTNLTFIGPTENIFTNSTDSERTQKLCLYFDGEQKTIVNLGYNSTYAPTDEFTLSFWSQSPSWSDVPNIQLAGNYSSNGGYGIFLQNLNSYPFFVLPETKYGHVLFVNEGLNGYLDQSVQQIPKVPAAAAYTAIDFNQHVVVCIEDNSGVIYKLDNAGKIIASSKETKIPFNYIHRTEVPIQLLIGRNNTIVIRTNKIIYTFDEHLNVVSRQQITTSKQDVAAFRYNTALDFDELNIAYNVKDSKFIESTQWLISADGNVYRKYETGGYELFYDFKGTATNLNIDPLNRVWVMYDNNSIAVFDSTVAALNSPIFKTSVGQNITHPIKNLNFFCQFDTTTKETKWLAVVYFSNEKYLYILDLNGKSIKIVNVLSLFNSSIVEALEQVPENFQFLGKGDFTGYEHRRIFKNLTPFNNKNQLVLKTALRRADKTELYFEHFITRVPISWNSSTWQHIILTLSKNSFDLYLNGSLAMSQSIQPTSYLYYGLSPLFYIGSSAGSQSGFNNELQYKSERFKGLFADIKIFNYKINPNHYDIFLREAYKGQDITWALPSPSLQYVERIERFFKHKIPGHKAPFYIVKLRGTNIEDANLKNIVEEHIKALTEKYNPAYVDFLKIEWLD